MNLFELFVKIGVDDQASDKLKSFGSGVVKLAKTASAGLVAIGTAAVKSYADYEQLVGGVDTLFKDSSQKVQEYAANAFRTAGMSANEYMETVTSFSASLLQSLGGDTEKAAEKADMAITDMADNANKMGTSMEMIQNAYQGFAKQNYTMLDNLKLGYGGTKTEMERLVEDAEKLNSSFKASRDENGNLILSYSEVVDAIHIIQNEMGITGTTAKESAGTISGSFASMKAAASNFMTSLVSGNGDMKESFDTLKNTAFTFFDNLKPRIKDLWESIGPIGRTITIITGAVIALSAAAKILNAVQTVATAVQWAFNAAMNANPIGIIITLVAALVAGIVYLWNTNDGFKDALIKAWNSIKETAIDVWTTVADFFTETIPNAFTSVIDWFEDIGRWFYDIGSDIVKGMRDGIANAWNNLVSWFKGLFNDLIGIAKKILGIASPSKVFKKLGSFTADGFGIGFEDEFSHVKDDMEDAMSFDSGSIEISKATSKAGAKIGGTGFGNTSIGTIIINVDGAKYKDEKELATSIAQEIQNMTDRRAAVYA